MTNRSIMILVDGSPGTTALDRVIESARVGGIHVRILVTAILRPAVNYAYGLDAYGAFPMSDESADTIEATKKSLTEQARLIEARLSEEGVSGEVAVLSSDIFTLQRVVARMALTVDGLLIGDDVRGDTSLFDTFVQTALFQSPSGLMLNAVSAPRALTPARVFVAWNSGLPAARALAAARTWLADGAEITVGIFDADATGTHAREVPGSDVARWLSHSGYRVAVQNYPSGGEEIGACILNRARETGADLVVTGAYGHARMREMIFGGTTRTLMQQTGIPLLLAH